METNNVFHIADYCVLVGLMLVSLLIGIYYAFSGGKQRTTAEYFVGNRSMGAIPITLSLLASYFSSNTFLGVPAEVYAFGLNWWFCLVGAILAMPFVAYWIMPVFYHYGSTNIYDYLELRFNRRIRFTTLCFALTDLAFYAAFVTYGPALALSQVTGLNFWASVVTITVIGTLYTAIGGIKAVMWTDSLQVIIIILAITIVVVKGIMDLGFREIYIRNLEGRRIESLSFSFDPRIRFSFWNLSLYSLFMWGGTYGMAQFQVQRYLSAPSIHVARRALWLNIPGHIIVQCLVCLIGLLMYAKYSNCDPLSTNRIEALDQLFPLYVMDTLGDYPGLPGLFVAGIFSGSLSTTSSILNSVAVLILDDFIKPYKRWSLISDEKATVFAKFIAVIFGFFTILMVGIISVVGSDIQQANGTIVGSIYGTKIGVFFAALFCPWIQSTAVLIGMFSGFAFSTWVGLGINLSKANILQKLPISSECLYSANISSFNRTDIFADSHNMTVIASNIPKIYQISYLWNFVFCILIVLIASSSFCAITREDFTYDHRLYSPIVNYIHDKILKRRRISKRVSGSYRTCPKTEQLARTKR